jgi:L-threonylcarbamoyladenylate synthase
MSVTMVTRVVLIEPGSPDPAAIAEAARILRTGGLVVVPTETVYGIAADAMSAAAVERLRRAKGRPDTKPLPVMVGGADEMDRLASRVPAEARRLAEAFWPGPLTIVLPASPVVGEHVHAGTGAVGLRSPDDPVARAVLRACGGPLALTSANLSGEPEAADAATALSSLEGRVDLILDAGPCRLGRPSTVLDLSSEPPRVLREGAVSVAELREYVVLG